MAGELEPSGIVMSVVIKRCESDWGGVSACSKSFLRISMELATYAHKNAT